MLNFKDVILLLQNEYCIEYNGSLIISFYDDDSFESGDGNVIVEFDNESCEEIFDDSAIWRVFQLDEIELSNNIHYLSKIIKKVEDYDIEYREPKYIFVSLDNNITKAKDVIEHLFDGSFNYSIKELTLVKNVEKVLTQLKIAPRQLKSFERMY